MLTPLTTSERVATMLGVYLPDDGVDRRSVDQAVEDASALVYGYIGRDTVDKLRPGLQAVATHITTRVAARIHRNPQEASSTSFNDMSISLADPRTLTGDEKTALNPLRAINRGPIPQVPTSLEEYVWTW